MMDNPHPWVSSSNGVHDLWRMIGAAIIHQNEFVIRAQVPQHFRGGFINAADIVLLIVAREKDAERVHARADGTVDRVWHQWFLIGLVHFARIKAAGGKAPGVSDLRHAGGFPMAWSLNLRKTEVKIGLHMKRQKDRQSNARATG